MSPLLLNVVWSELIRYLEVPIMPVEVQVLVSADGA